MALPVETGEGLVSSESFVTVGEARAFAGSRGASLPSSDNEVEVLLRRAHSYISAIENRFSGVRTNPRQSLPFPRSGAYQSGEPLDGNEIPVCLKNAVAQVVLEIHNGVDVLPNTTGAPVIREKLGPLETEYATNGIGSRSIAKLPIVDAFLAPLTAVSSPTWIMTRV